MLLFQLLHLSELSQKKPDTKHTLQQTRKYLHEDMASEPVASHQKKDVKKDKNL